MKLYSIWHRDKQRFWKGDYWNGTQQWGRTPRFWQTIDGVRNNLVRVGSDYQGVTFHSVGEDFDGSLPGEIVLSGKRYANFDLSNLRAIEIVVTNVKVLGETRLSAADLMKEGVAA